MKYIIAWLILLTVTATRAQIGNSMIDATFGSNGIAMGNPGNNYSVYYSVGALQPDGKIVVAGTVDSGYTTIKSPFIMRFNSDGSLDNTFAQTGYIQAVTGSTKDSIVAIALQADGKIVTAGLTNQGHFTPENVLVMRYTTTGTLDNTFGTGGRKVISSGGLNLAANAVAIESDQKIVVAGYKTNNAGTDQFMVARLTTTGALDNTFGSNGVTTTNFYGYGDDAFALAIQPDQKIVLAGTTSLAPYNFGYAHNLAVARYTSNGALDNTFGTGGKFHLSLSNGGDQVCGVGLQSTGNIIVAGTPGYGFATVRFTPLGVIDSSFGFDGIARTGFEQNVGSCYAMTIDGSDNIVLTGATTTNQNYHISTAYCNIDGNPQISWGTQGRTLTPQLGNGSDIPYTAVVQPDNKILLVGTSQQGNNARVVMERYYATQSAANDIATIANDNAIKLYPNPTNNKLFIQFNTSNTFTNYTVYDALGRTTLTGTVNDATEMLDVSALTPGVYLLRLNNNNKQAANTFVVER